MFCSTGEDFEERLQEEAAQSQDDENQSHVKRIYKILEFGASKIHVLFNLSVNYFFCEKTQLI